MKKTLFALSLSLVGSNFALASSDDTEYAKKLSYCTGIGWASKTHAEAVQSRFYVEPQDWQMQMWIATARVLTDQKDEVLKSEFRAGYQFGHEEIQKLDSKLKGLPNPNSFDGDDLKIKMNTIGSTCVPDTDLTTSTYEKLGNITENDIVNNSIADLKTWL